MRCDECGNAIDPETDRHLLTRERLVAPQLAGEDVVVRTRQCEACMDPTFATLTRVQETLDDRLDGPLR